jgi:hypothetical protein
MNKMDCTINLKLRKMMSRKIGKAKAYQSNDRCLEAAAAFGTIRKT